MSSWSAGRASWPGIEHFIIDLDADSMVIYTPNTDPRAAAGLLDRLFGGFPSSEADWIARHAHYTAMLRFTLIDGWKRLYTIERWCFRGGIDNWLLLAAGKPLEALAGNTSRTSAARASST